tara:strand:+ start:213 stop:650 length:438 start_codon:yes stop_codon:yes gene_type:complete
MLDKLEKLIYSVKYLPQVLYFGSAGLLLLVIFLDVRLIELLIPLFIFFIYMTYLASKNYKSNGGTNGLEKFIYSIKYLPQILYFGSVAWLIYTYYFGDYLENEIQIFGYVWNDSLLEDIFFFWFLYITYLGVKNLKTKDEFGGNK